MYYDLYMEDAVNDFIQDMNDLPMYSGITEAGGKEGVYKENYFLKNNLQIPFVSNILDKPRIRESLFEFTGGFINDHEEQLSTAGPVKMFTFADKETSVLYDMFNINAEQLMNLYNKMVDETFYGNISAFLTGMVKNAPHKLLLVAVLIESLQKNYEETVECCEYLFAFSEYPLVFRKFWPYGVKEDLMAYTIEHLGSKYKAKKMNNLLALLKYDSHSAVSHFTPALMKGVDNVYTDFIYRIRTQMKATFKNINREYKKNLENNATQHTNVSVFDDGSLADQEGHTTLIAQITDNTVNKFATGGINRSLANIAAENAQVDKDNLIGFIGQIMAIKSNKLNKFVENVVTAYLNKNPTDTSVGSSSFLTFGLALYRSIGTSKDPLYQELRIILNLWMFDIINIRQSYQREATVIAYTRAIFNYYIMMIMHYN